MSSEAREIGEKFLKLELEYDLFDIYCDGVPLWERIRVQTYNSVMERAGATGQAHDSKSNSLSSRALRTLRGLLQYSGQKNALFATNHEILIWGHQRRKRLEDGYWWDLYTDPLHEEVSMNYLQIERDHMGTHFRPEKTDELWYTDFIENSAKILRELNLKNNTLESEDERVLRNFQMEISNYFGIDINLIQSARNAAATRPPLCLLYKKLLQKVDPKLVLVVVSYGKEDFIEACKALSIPVIELQHGVIYDHHLGYSYPGPRQKTMFPDYLFTFGEYWNDAVEYPIPAERVRTVGYPYLEQRLRQYPQQTDQSQILVLSQGTVGRELSKFAVSLSRDSRVSPEVVYKLHPGEYGRWAEEYPWLTNESITIVDSNHPPLYKLLSESDTQIGVSSTALFEGTRFGLSTFLLNLPTVEVCKPLIDQGDARIIESVDEFVKLQGESRNIEENIRLFACNPIDNFCANIEQILDSEYNHRD
jgi:hypothetical protein